MIDSNFASATTDEEAELLLAEARRAAVVRALRRFVLRHNGQALVLAFFSFVTAAALWGLVYFFAYWFTLIFATLSRSFSPATLAEINDPGLVSAQFPWWFLGGALVALAVAWVVRGRVRLESLREARYYLLWVIVELLMAIPNVTFSIWGNLSPLVRMPRSEAASAWRLLERINHEGGRLSMASLRLEIEDERLLQHVVFVLQIVGLVDMREKREGWYLCLHNRDAFALLNRVGQAP